MTARRIRIILGVVILAGVPAFGQSSGLGAPVVEALEKALDDERKAQAIYTSVLDRHQGALPFAHVLRAEENHEAALLRLFDKHDIEAPTDPWPEKPVDTPMQLKEACSFAVEAEIDNIALYDELLALDLPSDVRQVFLRLQAASSDRHLPAFSRCVEADGAYGGHGGRGPGAGMCGGDCGGGAPGKGAKGGCACSGGHGGCGGGMGPKGAMGKGRQMGDGR